jgi:glycosyltransferase involved in cell wall biosynthesis
LKKNILCISPHFNLACGVSKHVFTILTSEELKKEFNMYFITNGGDALFKLDKAGINHSIINFKTDKIIHFDFFRNTTQLKNFCKEKKINLVHSHHRYPEYLSNYIKKSLGIKTITTVHNFVSGFKHFSYKSDRIIAINNSVKEHLYSSFDIDKNRVEVLYNCVRNDDKVTERMEKIKQSLSITGDCPVILFLGRIIKEKGIDVLVNAYKFLSANNRKVILIIVGSGDFYLNDIKSISTDEIKIYPPTGEIQKFYAIANIVVLPSIKEPFGYTMLEAGLNKIPFIGSRTGGISEFIEDGINGYLFDPGDPIDLADKIKFVLDHPDEAKIASLKLNEKVNRLCNCEEYSK